MTPSVRTAWVDGGLAPNPGQFPIKVETHLNRFVSLHLPGVTTVTRGARYYALHGLVARVGEEEALSEVEVLDVLRRSEALLAYVTDRHAASKDHVRSTPSPHGIDAIRRHACTGSGLDLVKARDHYSDAKWAFSNAYRGSELTLKILSPEGFLPGEWYDPERAASGLAPLVDVARRHDQITEEVADQLSSACLCQMTNSEDAAWLSCLLTGDRNVPTGTLTAGGLLWQFGRTVVLATEIGSVSDAASVGDLLMFDEELRELLSDAGIIAAERWRGALLRKESVHALRLIWKNISDRVGGAMPVEELVEQFASSFPDDNLGDFVDDLPVAVTAEGVPLPAERSLELDGPRKWVAMLILGSARLGSFSEQEALGFSSNREWMAGQWEELSPGWIRDAVQRHRGQSLRAFGRMLATVLIHRSQRVALWKSGYRSGRFVFPARLHVRDGVAVRVFGETAPEPATRIPQYLSIATQAGIFAQDGTNGQLTLGPNGGPLA